MPVTIKQIEIPKNTRILVTSDIHGHLSLFKKLIREAAFSEKDILFIIGDLIEKGPESLSTLRYVMRLCEMRNVIVLAGNVDIWRIQMLSDVNHDNCEAFYQYLIRMRDWCGSSVFDEMAGELGLVLDSPKKIVSVKQVIQEAFQKEFDFLRNLPAVVETQNYIFVHAGLPCNDLSALKDRDLFEVLKFDDFMSAGLSFDRYVVVGHWPVKLYDHKIAQSNPIINRKQHIIAMDGGCGVKEDGQLNLLIIPEIDCNMDEIICLHCDNFPVLEAVTPQKPSADSINIRFTDNKIRILERGEEFSYVEHLSSGYCLRMYNHYIYDFDDAEKVVTSCEDYTDYLLPVAAGDKLSLIHKTSEGCMVKKNGVSGWYLGELR